MAKFHKASKWPVIAIFIVALWLTSCKTSRELPRATAKPISTSKLLKNVEENSFDYKNFSVKRINCQFSSNKSKSTFKVSLKAIKDKEILVAISKLNIPVGRVLLTPDSVKYVNYIDRNYFVDDYQYLSSFLNIDLDFATIQSILSNNAFSYRNDEKNKDFKTFESFIESGMYVLHSEKEKKIFKLDEKGKTGKIERRFKRLDDNALILQKMYFNPGNFALNKLLIIDKTNERKMEMDFDEFVKVGNKDYPGSIEMSFISEFDDVRINIRMNGFSTEKLSPLSINIPEKYEEIRVK